MKRNSSVAYRAAVDRDARATDRNRASFAPMPPRLDDTAGEGRRSATRKYRTSLTVLPRQTCSSQWEAIKARYLRRVDYRHAGLHIHGARLRERVAAWALAVRDARHKTTAARHEDRGRPGRRRP